MISPSKGLPVGIPTGDLQTKIGIGLMDGDKSLVQRRLIFLKVLPFSIQWTGANSPACHVLTHFRVKTEKFIHHSWRGGDVSDSEARNY